MFSQYGIIKYSLAAANFNKNVNFSFIKNCFKSFSNMKLNTINNLNQPMFLQNNFNIENMIIIKELSNINKETINTPQEEIKAEFMNKKSKLAKRKRAKRRDGKQISLRYR